VKYLSILNSTLDGLIVIDRNGIIKFCNNAAYSMLGYSNKELEGLSVEVLLPKAFRHAHAAMRAGYMDMPRKRMMNPNQRFTALRKDNTEFPVAISLNPTEIDGESYVCASIQDVTQVEEEAIRLEKSQKLEALGEMVSGIAHNFNNVLAGISGNSYLLSRNDALSEKDAKRVKSISSLCNQAATIIKQLLIYSRNDNMEMESFQLGEAIYDIVQIAKITAPEKISIQLSEEINDLSVFGNKNQIEQTLLNIINNAVQAIGKSEGSINISTLNCEGDGCKLKQCSLNRKDAGAFICIRVRDTGKGISAENINRVFDPFFSTKPLGQGTGLGLSTSYGIIKKHGGEISVSSIEGKGAMFQMFLPASGKENAVKSVQTLVAPAVSSNDTFILVVDDDSSVRDVLSEVLHGFGYSILTASDGEAGVKLFKEQKDKIELVICDVSMPKLDGQEVMERIRRIKSKVPIMFITGYQDSSVDEEVLGDKTQVMLKPFDYVELSHKVKNMLNNI